MVELRPDDEDADFEKIPGVDSEVDVNTAREVEAAPSRVPDGVV